MHKKIELRKISLFLCIYLFLSFFLVQKITIAKAMAPFYFTKLTLENRPQIGEVAVLKLEVIATFDKSKVDIGCFMPEGIEVVKDNESRIIFSEPLDSPERGERVVFYSGSMKKGEKKEFTFKARIPDGGKYIVSGGAVGIGDHLEIDLGDPEPPEWKAEKEKRVGIREGRYYIRTGIKQVSKEGMSELHIPEDSLPPLRTELKIRTKYKSYIRMPYNPQEIPLRYLVYTEEGARKVEVTVELPEGLELINGQNYKIKQQKFKLFQGPMRFRECKAFYFKVRSDKKERFRVKVQMRMLTAGGEEFVAEDYQDIELGNVLY